MPRLIWSATALRDLVRLHAFLVTKNPAAARRAVATIRQSLRLLERHPQAGRPAVDMPVEFREWPIAFASGSYIALYRNEGQTVVIVVVRHSREMDYEA